MLMTIAKLVNGSDYLKDYYIRAVERWEELWQRPEWGQIYQMAAILPKEVDWFRANCGGGWLAEEIMVVSGFGAIWAKQEQDEAAKREEMLLLYSAFAQSDVPVQVLAMAQQMTDLLGVWKEERVA